MEEELVTAFFLLDGIAMMLLFLTRTFTLPYCTMIVPSSPGDSTTVANLPPNPFTWTCSPICGVYEARSASLMENYQQEYELLQWRQLQIQIL